MLVRLVPFWQQPTLHEHSTEVAGRHTGSAQNEAGALERPECDLLIVAGPTQRHGVSPAMQEWLERLPRGALKDVPAAAFDTRYRMSRLLGGSAAARIASRLKKAGARLVVPPESFFMERDVLLPLFLWYTRWVYWRLAKEVVRDIEDYVRSGFEVVGIVGVGGSPSCGVCSRLDLRRSLEVVAGCPLARLDRRVMNEEAIADCLSEGEGLFIAALQHQLRRKHLTIRWYEHELLAEIRGQQIRLRARDA